jgi:hypothetical protein
LVAAGSLALFFFVGDMFLRIWQLSGKKSKQKHLERAIPSSTTIDDLIPRLEFSVPNKGYGFISVISAVLAL